MAALREAAALEEGQEEDNGGGEEGGGSRSGLKGGGGESSETWRLIEALEAFELEEAEDRQAVADVAGCGCICTFVPAKRGSICTFVLVMRFG
jgi:hypothetical protein